MWYGARLQLESGPLAQLDRASDYESEGRVFESPRAHQLAYRYVPLGPRVDASRAIGVGFGISWPAGSRTIDPDPKRSFSC